MAVVEDRSAEEERDLAQLEIGALMDTAGVGVATFDSARGWLRPRAERRRAPAKVGRAAVDRARHRRARVAARIRTAAAGLAPRRTHRGALCGEPCRAGAALAAHPRRAGRRRFRPAHGGHGGRDRAGKRAAPEPAAAARADDHPRRHHGRHRLPARRDAGALQPPLRIHARAGGRRRGRAPRSANCSAASRRRWRALQAGQSFETELALALPGGTPAWYSLSVRRAEPAAGDNEVVAVLTDISRLKSQQAELEALLRDRELMFSLSDVGIAYLRGARIERANQAMAALSGYADSELTALDPAELALDRDDAPAPGAGGTARAAPAGPLPRRAPAAPARRQPGVGAGGAAAGGRGRRTGRAHLLVRRRAGAAPRARNCCARPKARGRSSIRCWWASSPSGRRHRVDEPLGAAHVRRRTGRLRRRADRHRGHARARAPAAPHRLPRHAGRRPAQTFECRLKARDGREFWVVGNAVLTGRGSSAAGR